MIDDDKIFGVDLLTIALVTVGLAFFMIPVSISVQNSAEDAA